MAVSGRKASDFVGSITYGSIGGAIIYCEPCLKGGQHIEFHGYCVDCEEYLCKNCFLYHPRTKAWMNHQLLDKKNLDKRPLPTKPPASLTEKCTVHSSELIKFFCPRHETLGCNDCITLEHRACKIDYIPEQCCGIGDSQLYHDVMKDIDDEIREADEIARETIYKDLDVERVYDKALKDIENFEREIIRQISELKKRIQKEAYTLKTKDKQALKNLLESCNNISINMKKSKSEMIAARASNKEGQLYIDLIRARTSFHSSTIQESRKSLKRINPHYTFECNKDLKNILSSTRTLGDLVISGGPSPSPNKQVCDTLKSTENVNVRTRSDRKVCDITGCAVLSCDKVVLADWNNKKIKVVDIEKKIVQREKQLDTKPWDVTILPYDQIAVTLREAHKVLILASDSRLTTKHHIPVNQKCWGITYHDGCLYVVCWDPHCVLILNLQGKVKHTISLDSQTFSIPVSVVCHNEVMYISDVEKNSVASVTLQGEVAVSSHKDLSAPKSMAILKDGSLLVCCRDGSIYHISGDLKQCRTVVGGLVSPESMCVGDQVFIASENCDLLTYSDTLSLDFTARV